MNLSSKHQQQIISYGDFHGGLNTTTVPEMIGDTQVAKCMNMEFNRSTGALQTSCGTDAIYVAQSGYSMTDAFYDPINNQFLVVCTDRKVYHSQFTDMSGSDPYDFVSVGTLTGSGVPIAAVWENGLLIASGGHLQYWTGLTLTTLSYSPSKCNGVFVKNGRVYVWYEDTLQCSAVGDETSWTTSSSDESTSQWLDIGYKEGENEKSYIIGVVPLSSDMIVIKADGKVYRVSGEYPNWSVNEITRFGQSLNARTYAAVQDGVFILDRHNLVYLQPTQAYGDIKPTNVAANISGLLNQLDTDNSRMDYIPSLNQLWITNMGTEVVIYDLNFNAFTERKFSKRVMDIIPDYQGVVLLIKNNLVTRLLEGEYKDCNYSSQVANISWNVTCKSFTSFNEHLLKKVRMSYAPQTDIWNSASVITAGGKISIPITKRNISTYPILGSFGSTLVASSTTPINPSVTQFVTQKMMHRDITLDMRLEGVNAPIMINRIDCGVAEVR